MSVIKTAESVCKGHPDKLCDTISESILDSVLASDKNARVAIESTAAVSVVNLMGELTTTANINLCDIAAKALSDNGYDPNRFQINSYVHQQSAEIAAGVSSSIESLSGDTAEANALGAGDQGTVYGYAVAETDQMLPAPLVIAHKICAALDKQRESGEIPDIFSDGKAQVSVEYDAAGVIPLRVTAIVVSIQHAESFSLPALKETVLKKAIIPALGDLPLCRDAIVLINPAGAWHIGGPVADSGLTGRKLAVDTYGGLALHGGGAFAGKDPSKVDKSAALQARNIAKTIVSAGLAQRATVAISYAIGRARPVVFWVNSEGTGKYSDSVLTTACEKIFGLTPGAMIAELSLLYVSYASCAYHGYFTKQHMPWERASKKDELILALKELRS